LFAIGFQLLSNVIVVRATSTWQNAMSKRKRNSATEPSPKSHILSGLRSRFVVMSSVALLGISTISLYFGAQNASIEPQTRIRRATVPIQKLPTFSELAMMNNEELSKQDLALLNLRAAEELPGAEKINVVDTMAELDRWANRVRNETENNLQQFYKSPGDFRNSIAYFRMLMLVTVLQQDFGAHYNLQRINNIDFTRSQDLFIHGLVGATTGAHAFRCLCYTLWWLDG
jgi:hypothetical protein